MLTVQGILFSAVLMAGVWWGLVRALGLSMSVGAASGFFVLCWSLFPVLRVHARSRGSTLGPWRYAVGSLMGAGVSALVFGWLA